MNNRTATILPFLTIILLLSTTYSFADGSTPQPQKETKQKIVNNSNSANDEASIKKQLQKKNTPDATTYINKYDQRQALPLNKAQQAHVLAEMRSLLDGIQGIIAALVSDDMEAVAKNSRPLGMGMKQNAENTLHGILPKAFMKLGKSVHMDFDKIADDAGRVKDSKHTLRQLSEMIKKCQGCHKSYRIEVKNQ